jgi:hypothetical protein
MTRRGLISLAMASALLPGCGMSVRKLDEEALAAATTVSRVFPEPPHRVALAAFEAMRAELASAEFVGDSEFMPYRGKPKELQLPGGLAFDFEWKDKDGKPSHAPLVLQSVHFRGKTAEGRSVDVRVIRQDGQTLATVRVDELGDRMFSQWLLDRFADRLAHPATLPGSPEEAAAFQAFFGGVESREALPSLRKPKVEAR